MSSETGLRRLKPSEMGGGIQKRIYLVEHPKGLDASQKHQRIAQDAGGDINHPDPGHWGGDYRKSKPQICHRKELAANASPIPTKRTFGERYQKSEWNEMWRETGVFIKLLFWPLDRGARKRNSGKYLRLVDFRQIIQAMVCREVPADETGFWRVLRQHKNHIQYEQQTKRKGGLQWLRIG